MKAQPPSIICLGGAQSSGRIRSDDEPLESQVPIHPSPGFDMGSISVSTNALTSPLATHRNNEKPVDLNVRNVVLGDVLFKAWYPSFYPEEMIGRELERLFVCQWCFKYSKDLMPYLAHTVRIRPKEVGKCCTD